MKTWLVEPDVQNTVYNPVQCKCKIWLAEANPSEISRWLRFFRGRRSLALINI